MKYLGNSLIFIITLIFLPGALISDAIRPIKTWSNVPKGSYLATFQTISNTGGIELKVVAGSEEVIFYDEAGNSKSAFNLRGWLNTGVLRSQNGKAYGIMTMPKIEQDEDSPTQTSYFFDEDGKNHFSNGSVFSAVSDDRETGVVCSDTDSGDGTTIFCNKDGILAKDLPLDGKPFGGGEGSFSGDGKFFLEMIDTPPALVLYSGDGKKIWSKNLDFGRLRSFGISNSAKYLAVLAYDDKKERMKAYCLSHDGTVLWTKDDFGGMGICQFSPDEEYLVIANHRKKEMALIESGGGKELWRKSSSVELDADLAWAGEVTAIAVSPGAQFVAMAKKLNIHSRTGGEPKDRTGQPREIRVFDKQGNQVMAFSVDSDPSLQIVGDKLLVIAGTAITEYSLKP